MDLKSITLTGLKAAGDEGSDLEEGQFEAYASTWTRTPDSYGDVVAKGAFEETLGEWAKSGLTLPILYGHDIYDPFNNIGGATQLEEDSHGLKVRGQLDLENPTAKQVYRLLKGRRINQMSFAYDVLEDGIVDLGDEKSARELRKLKLHEISVVPFGANADTEVLAVKANAQALKAGRAISSKNLETLRSAYAALGAVIKSAEGSTNDTDDETSQGKRSDETQERKSDTASRRSALATASFYASL